MFDTKILFQDMWCEAPEYSRLGVVSNTLDWVQNSPFWAKALNPKPALGA